MQRVDDMFVFGSSFVDISEDNTKLMRKKPSLYERICVINVIHRVEIMENDNPLNLPKERSVIDLYGITDQGDSILVHCYGYIPYFYIFCNVELTDEYIMSISEILKGHNNRNEVKVERVIRSFYENPCDPQLILKVSNFFGDINSICIYLDDIKVENLEIANDFRNRFINDYDIHGCAWIRPTSTWKSTKNEKRKSKCQHEVECLINEFEVSGNTDYPVFRTLSIYIQEIADDIIISTTLSNDEILHSTIFSTKLFQTTNLVDLRVSSSKETTISSFNRYIQDIDPDIIVQYDDSNEIRQFLYDLKGDRYIFIPFYKLQSDESTSSRQSFDLIIEKILGKRHFVIPKTFFNTAYNMNDCLIMDYFKEKSVLMISCLKQSFFLEEMIEISRVYYLPFKEMMFSGQTVRVKSLIHKKLNEREIVINKNSSLSKKRPYFGGFVLPPICGLYTHPVLLLDFKSLYPSIMVESNICVTTNSDNSFIPSSIYTGAIPEILKTLMNKRNDVKNNDMIPKTIKKRRETALKKGSNSIYGVLGSAYSNEFYYPDLAESITQKGKEILEKTKAIIESNFKDLIVIYGDTDSLFVYCKDHSLPVAIEIGKSIVNLVNESFLRPINIVLQEIYQPFLLISKKHYIGVGKFGDQNQIQFKGVETERSDSNELVQVSMRLFFKNWLLYGNVDLAIQHLRKIELMVSQDKYSIYPYICTKSIGKDPSEYKTKIPIVELAKRISNEKGTRSPTKDDIIDYVYLNSGKSKSKSDQIEDPLTAALRHYPIDYKYYNDSLFEKITKKIPEQDCSQLVQKIISIKIEKKMIQRMDKDNLEIISLKNGYLKELTSLNALCSHCKGSLFMSYECDSHSCPIRFRRIKVMKDIEDLTF